MSSKDMSDDELEAKLRNSLLKNEKAEEDARKRKNEQDAEDTWGNGGS